MNEVVLLILNYLPPVLSVGALAVIGKVIVKQVTKKLADFAALNSKLNLIAKRLSEEKGEKDKLEREIEALRMELKGFKQHE